MAAQTSAPVNGIPIILNLIIEAIEYFIWSKVLFYPVMWCPANEPVPAKVLVLLISSLLSYNEFVVSSFGLVSEALAVLFPRISCVSLACMCPKRACTSYSWNVLFPFV